MYRVNFILSVRIYVCSWPQFSVLMLSRVIGGMSAGMVMPGVTGLIADVSPSHQKAKTLATCQRLSILDSF